MEGMMTDYQYRTVLRSVKMIIHGCRDISEAEARLDELIEEKAPRNRKKEEDDQDE